MSGFRRAEILDLAILLCLGRDVICTCAKSDERFVHFDIKHLSFIFWEDLTDLRERLFQRIRGTIGLGPFTRFKPDEPTSSQV